MTAPVHSQRLAASNRTFAVPGLERLRSGRSARPGLETWLRTRGALYCGLTVIGFANGITEKVVSEIDRAGPFAALFGTFGISVFVWTAAIVVILLLSGGASEPAERRDFLLAGACLAAFALPVPALSWLALSGVGLYLAWSRRSPEPFRRAGAVLVAITATMLWTRVAFAVLSAPLLAADAWLVSWIIGTRSSGNTVPFADGSGMIFLEPACSSLTNVSLAVLCTVLFVNLKGQSWSARNCATMAAAAIATMIINVTRIALIGLYPAYYDAIHGSPGATIAGWLSVTAMVAISAVGVRNDAPRAA
jgi:exosortase/archaeosortase family protein